jgi:hypothetical protein
VALVEPFVPTDREKKVANVLGALLAVVGFGTIVLINVEHSWWPVVAGGMLTLCMVVAVTTWCARGRHQRFWETFLHIARSSKRS